MKRGNVRFVDVCPELVEEWDRSENIQPPEYYSVGSGYKAAWICKECGRHYRSTIHSRAVMGTGCRKCHFKLGLEKRLKIFEERRNNPKPLTYNFKIAKYLQDTHSGNPELLWRCPDCGYVWSAKLKQAAKQEVCLNCLLPEESRSN